MLLHERFVFPSRRTEHEKQVLFHRSVGQQFIVLEDDTEPATQVGQLPTTDMHHIVVQHTRLTHLDG